MKNYSVLNDLIGFAIAAFIACRLTVINATSNTIMPAIKNIHQRWFRYLLAKCPAKCTRKRPITAPWVIASYIYSMAIRF